MLIPSLYLPLVSSKMLDISSGLYEQREGCDEAVNLRGRIIVKIECPDNVG